MMVTAATSASCSQMVDFPAAVGPMSATVRGRGMASIERCAADAGIFPGASNGLSLAARFSLDSVCLSVVCPTLRPGGGNQRL
eukprot:scaffold4786_cov104-Isochrysis_galbana.AAC.3